MSERITTILVIIVLLIFGIYQNLNRNRQVVLKIITPTVVQVDINGNNIVDGNETFCIPNIETFSANIKRNSETLARQLGLTFGQSLAIGYLADNFAYTNLEGKEVKLKISDKQTPECRYAEIFIGDKNYSDMLKDSGLAIIDSEPVNKEKFETIKEKAYKQNLVIVNHNSSKYHTLDCKYGQIARDSIILPLKELQNNLKPCNFCHVKQRQGITLNKNLKNEIPPPPNIITDGNIQLILTNFIKILKPDRNCSHAVCKELVNSIKNAHSSIDIAAYGWADIPAVNKALRDAVNRNVKIRIVYDTNSKHTNYYDETDEFIKQFGTYSRSDEIQNNPKLTNMLMHNKFIIFDKQKVYTGSMNFSTTGLSGFNHNNVLIINSKEIAELYESEFDKMYEGKFHTLKSKTHNNLHIKAGSGELSVYFSPQDKGITSGIIPLIKNSKKYIYIPTFLITHKALKDELINAHNKGIDIKIIIDATNTYGKHSIFKELRDSGIPVKVENYAGKMHSKAMIIDDEYLILGSANFSNSGENKNDENLIILKNTRLTKLYKDYFNYFWQIIPDKYLKQTVRAEGKYSVGSCYDGVDNNFDGKIDNNDSGCKK